MGKAPRVTASDVKRILGRAGFKLDRSKGSHQIYTNEQGHRVTVPEHGQKILHPKTLASIVKDMDITMDEFERQLRGN